MKTKTCNKCNVEKPIEEFSKSYNKKYNKYYVRCYCKECGRTMSRINMRKYYKTQEGIKKRKEYLGKNREKILEKARINSAIYKKNHREEIRAKNKIYREKNKEKINAYFKTRYLNDYIYRFKNTIRNAVRMSFRRKGKAKIGYAEDILGCDIEFLINYLIRTYENNYNEKWNWKCLENVHIDHKKPLKYATTEEEVIKLCHYTNLQLLKAEDNLKKHTNII